MGNNNNSGTRVNKQNPNMPNRTNKRMEDLQRNGLIELGAGVDTTVQNTHVHTQEAQFYPLYHIENTSNNFVNIGEIDDKDLMMLDQGYDWEDDEEEEDETEED